jgi:threonine synthase
LESGTYTPRPSVATISNAMDVGAPSNFVRMSALFGNSWENFRGCVSGMSFTDEETRAAIREAKTLHGYEVCPHTAVGWLAAKRWHATHPGSSTVTLATAHPAKFPDVMDAELGAGAVEIPGRLAVLADKEKVATGLPKDWETFRGWLAANIA